MKNDCAALYKLQQKSRVGSFRHKLQLISAEGLVWPYQSQQIASYRFI